MIIRNDNQCNINIDMLSKQVELLANQRLWSIDWHPEGNMIVSVGENKTIKFWKRGKDMLWKLYETLTTDHTKSLRCIRFDHTGKSFAVASFDSTISIYILAQDGYQFLSLLEGHQNQVKCIDWSPSDKKIVSCSRDKNVWIWSFNQSIYEYECENVLEGHTEDVKHVIWLDQSTVASASYDNTIRIWCQNDDDFECDQILEGHQSIVWALSYDRIKRRLFSCSEDRKIIQWSRNQNSERFQFNFTFQDIHAYPIYTCSLLNSEFLFTGSGDNSVTLIRIDNKQKDNIVSARQYHQGDVNSVRCISKNGEYECASCGDDQKLIIWRIKLQ